MKSKKSPDMSISLRWFVSFLLILIAPHLFSQVGPREKMLMDKNWRFSLGHPYDNSKDFNYATSYFSFFAKAGFADGPASPNFDDRAWRKLDVPHDWAVEAPFDSMASLSHGFKAIGRNFPNRSIGWYRKTFSIPQSDDGKRITVEFDGVFRNSVVWINGHCLGIEPSGYSSFSYDLTDYLNYGGSNVIVVRVDASMEEGWFYEGAGIYRHVWLVKTNPIHIAFNGTFVSSDINQDLATVKIKATVVNDGKIKSDFQMKHVIVNAKGEKIDSTIISKLSLIPGESHEFPAKIIVKNPKLWSLENPYLYKTITTITSEQNRLDVYETSFGIRSIRWDPDKGFFLNDKHIKLHGTNNHQDHAGVGAAIPDELQRFRISRLKEIGCNAYRCSHNPPTPELLKACDELGMLVIDENRLMGTNEFHFKELKRMMLRDRNHPSIILWSLGNEEWAMEGSDRGVRVASRMQDYARTLDSTRLYTTAISGGWGNGISTVIDVMGYNYWSHGSTDKQHKDFPRQPSVGTEEGATFSTRGIYIDDKRNCHLNAYDWDPTDWGESAEEGWSYYSPRDYVAGMFVWSGFDYRGEPTPFGWPAITSQFGILDLCGFPKDNSFYYKSWWTKSPMLHLFPHWNSRTSAGWKQGDSVKVWAYTNCEEVELFVNGKTAGRRQVPKDFHAEWKVTYTPGKLEAFGYIGGKKVVTDIVQTTGEGKRIQLQPHKLEIKADGEDLSVITVMELDSKNRFVPDANDEVVFTVQGPAKIIGVGNGDPSSLEADKYVEQVSVVNTTDWRVKGLTSENNESELASTNAEIGWTILGEFKNADNYVGKVYRGKFEITEKADNAHFKIFLPKLESLQRIYINGKAIQINPENISSLSEIPVDAAQLLAGSNVLMIVTSASKTNQAVREINASVQVVKPASQWKRKLFSGLAQVIIQSTGEPGEIILKAVSANLAGEIRIPAKAAKGRVGVD
jgi:beta-galactosidase